MKASIGSVFVAMSGGIDSAVAAWLLQREGYHCTGVTMRLLDGCGTEENIRDARSVAEVLGIPHRVFDFRQVFRDTVMTPFAEGYENGETPNPCLFCNRRLKLGRLLEEAKHAGAAFVATGHYARIERKNGRYTLRKAADLSKDQSYVLYMLTQEQLKHTLFPLGTLTKSESRRIAEEQGFFRADKPESQDICFIPDNDYAAFIERFTGKVFPPGVFVNRQGQVMGYHRGMIRYTVGQRRGLGLSLPEPYYVCDKDAAQNRVVLCTAKELPVRELLAKEWNWVSVEPSSAPLRASVRTRYHQKEQPAMLFPYADGSVRICLEEPGETVAASGQAAVAYDGDLLLGGGIIV